MVAQWSLLVSIVGGLARACRLGVRALIASRTLHLLLASPGWFHSTSSGGIHLGAPVTRLLRERLRLLCSRRRRASFASAGSVQAGQANQPPGKTPRRLRREEDEKGKGRIDASLANSISTRRFCAGRRDDAPPRVAGAEA